MAKLHTRKCIYNNYEGCECDALEGKRASTLANISGKELIRAYETSVTQMFPKEQKKLIRDELRRRGMWDELNGPIYPR